MSTAATTRNVSGAAERSSSASDDEESAEFVQEFSRWSEEWTARDTASVRLQLLGRVLCCRNKPRIRWIRSKGAILVLLWNCLILNFYGNLGPILNVAIRLPLSAGEIYFVLILVQALSEVLFYPLAGWVADVYFGRYRVVKASLWFMWAGTVLLGLGLCIEILFSPSHEWMDIAVKAVLFPASLIVLEAGIAGFHANAIPFGIDQLPTGSGDQLSGFITWFIFTSCIKWGFFPFPFSCPLMDSPLHNVLLQVLFQTVLLSVALILDFLFKDWLTIEPHTSNPFKLVARVLRYAWKNKQPQRRSAFTYQDHTKPSRIEFAKQSYGGPFTTEQVEDVKTFLRIVLTLIPIGAILVLSIFIGQTAALFSKHINSDNISCYGYNSMVYTAYFTVLCAIPLYEFLIHPILHNYIPSMLTRFGIGFVFYILSCVVLFTTDLMAHKEASNTTYSCIYDESTQEVNHPNINPLWTLLSTGLIGLGIVFNLTAAYEFVFSQSPYNMRGLLMGAVYATTGVFLFLGLPLQVPFHLSHVDHQTTDLSCGSVYLLVWLALSIVWFIVYVIFAHGYRKRERGETKRQQDYPEEYYSKYTGIN